MKTKLFISVIILLQLIVSCKPDPLTNSSIPLAITDIYYGGDADNLLDIYLPTPRNGNTRTIILIHGGDWSDGDKSDLTDYATYFAAQGFACVTMNYRLTGSSENNIHPAQINDISKAIEFVSAKALDFHISPTKFGLMGVTEGAHLALLYTYTANSNGKVRTVVSVSGVTDLNDTPDISPQLTPYIDALLGTNQVSAYAQASPANHISALTKPTFIFHGKQDNVILYQQALDLKTKLDAFSVKNDIRLYDNEAHDFTNTATIDSVKADAAAWFGENLR